MGDAGAAIVRMRTSASDAAKITERVTAEAAAGADAIRQAIEGVEQIRAETDQVVRAIGELVAQVVQISAVVEVIEAVADQTKLLALNASILAASVGEAGAGFAVVASSIKELAARTRGSTEEIVQMIRAAERAASGARGASGRIAQAVSEGVSRSLVAERALQSILDGVRTAREVTAQMAPAAEEQSRGADAVMTAMGGVATSVEVIAQAANEQADELRRIHRNMERLREVAQRVRARSGEQQAAARRVAQTVEGAATRIALVERAHAEQSGANEQLQVLVRTIAMVTERYRGVAKTLEQSAADLSGGASRLLERTRQLE
jgi:methyl-accepting chemotaxis protein